MILNYLYHQIFRFTKSGIYIYICEDYAQEFDITFNGAKSQFLVFRDRDCKVVTKSQISVNKVILVQDIRLFI